MRVADGTASDEPGEEAEIVLSLDGGKTFALRVSREVDPAGDVDAFLFTVPNLLSPRAVLGLRTGRDAEDERVVAVSEPFVVVAKASTPLEPLRTVRGEPATREEEAGRADEEPGRGIEPVGPSFVAAAEALGLEDARGPAVGAAAPSANLLSAPERAPTRLHSSPPPEALPSPFRPRRE